MAKTTSTTTPPNRPPPAAADPPPATASANTTVSPTTDPAADAAQTATPGQTPGAVVVDQQAAAPGVVVVPTGGPPTPEPNLNATSAADVAPDKVAPSSLAGRINAAAASFGIPPIMRERTALREAEAEYTAALADLQKIAGKGSKMEAELMGEVRDEMKAYHAAVERARERKRKAAVALEAARAAAPITAAEEARRERMKHTAVPADDDAASGLPPGDRVGYVRPVDLLPRGTLPAGATTEEEAAAAAAAAAAADAPPPSL